MPQQTNIHCHTHVTCSGPPTLAEPKRSAPPPLQTPHKPALPDAQRVQHCMSQHLHSACRPNSRSAIKQQPTNQSLLLNTCRPCCMKCPTTNASTATISSGSIEPTPPTLLLLLPATPREALSSCKTKQNRTATGGTRNSSSQLMCTA